MTCVSMIVVTSALFNTQVQERSSMRSRRLQAALDHLRGHSAFIDDLTDWLSDVHSKLLAANDMPAPTDVTALKAVICQQTVHNTAVRNSDNNYY